MVKPSGCVIWLSVSLGRPQAAGDNRRFAPHIGLVPSPPQVGSPPSNGTAKPSFQTLELHCLIADGPFFTSKGRLSGAIACLAAAITPDEQTEGCGKPLSPPERLQVGLVPVSDLRTFRKLEGSSTAELNYSVK